MSETGERFEKLVAVMRTLRSPEGCPWDREQTLESLTHFVLEEAHEVVDAIERGDMDALREEIGDHIFEGVFLAQVAAESGLFTDGRLAAHGRREAAAAPSARLPGGRPRARRRIQGARAVGRGGARSVELAEGAGARRHRASRTRRSAACRRACRRCCAPTRSASASPPSDSTGRPRRTSSRRSKRRSPSCARRSTKEPDNAARAEEEMGDLLFAIANLSRKLGIEPEAALRKANDKFTKRFNQLEANFHATRPHARRRDAGGDGGGVGEDQDATANDIRRHDEHERDDAIGHDEARRDSTNSKTR